MERNPVIIFGAQGLGKVALEIFKSNAIDVYCFLDDSKVLHNTTINEIAVMGSTDDDGFLKLIGKKCDAFIATDDNALRTNLANTLIDKKKVMPVNAVHQRAYISTDAEIGYGNLINAGAVISVGAIIKNNCVINSGAVIEQDAVLHDLVQVGAGSTIGVNVVIEQSAFIGSGVTVVSGVKIGKKARIGAGSVVIADVKNGETVFGNPAKVV